MTTMLSCSASPMTDMMVRCVLSRQALRLREIGPRLTLELVKVEKGLCAGDVLYHRHMEKTAEEVAQIKADKAAAAVRTPLRPLLWSFLSCRLPPPCGPFVCPCRLRLVVLLAVSCRSVWGSGL